MADTRPTTERAPYGRHAVPVLGTVRSDAPPATYYGQPAVKKSHYGWLIAIYLFVGGSAGAVQLIAQLADLLGSKQDRSVARVGRYLALIGSLVSPVLLIKDLHAPSRWYNMLRIFRSTSPMSIGSWTLATFGILSGLAAAGQALEDLFGATLGRRLARTFGIPAAAAGAVMSVYTGTLLAATSTPLWSVAYHELPPLFGSSAVATATALLSLVLEITGASRSTHARLARVGLLASGAQLVCASAAESTWRRAGLGGSLEQQPTATMYRLVVVALGMIAPGLIHGMHVLSGRRSPLVSTLAALATLAGGVAERVVVVRAGNESSQRPEDYFRITKHDVSGPRSGR